MPEKKKNPMESSRTQKR